jgi:hypothetical protein
MQRVKPGPAPSSLSQSQFGQPEQLKLFMSGTEWKNSITDSTDLGDLDNDAEGMGKLWSTKEAEARQPKEIKAYDVQWRGGRGHRVTIASSPNTVHGSGLYDSIKEKGYEPGPGAAHPTILKGNRGENTQWEGHHRVAAAAAIESDTGKHVWIPTDYRKRQW